jgi:hypothetical protein
MDIWMKVGMAVLLGGVLLFLLPRIKPMLAASRPAERGEWLTVALILLGVAGFVALLMSGV